MTTKIKGKIGIEIECFSKTKNNEKLRLLADELTYVMSSDGSIHDYSYSTESPHEFKSKVYELTEIKQLFIDVQKIYKLIKVNQSCGLHIHLSFEKMSNYYKLLCWKFIEKFQKEYELKFTTPIEQSRKWKNYSKFYQNQISFDLNTTKQIEIRHKNDSRFHCINFNAFNHYKTIEFRIFPATNKISKFKQYVKFLINIVETFLAHETFKEFEKTKDKLKPKEKKKTLIIKVITKNEINQLKLGGTQDVQH